MTINPFFQPSWPRSVPQEKEQVTFDSVVCSAVHFLFSVIFLPYGIYRLASAGVARFSAKLLYAAPTEAYMKEAHRRETKEYLRSQHNGVTVPLQTPDGYYIDNMLFRGEQRKALIYCTGRLGFYDSRDSFDYIDDIVSRVGDINMFLFNPRGVGDSEGVPSDHGLAMDVYSAFKYLVEVEHFAPEDIVIYGYSLGGGFGALGAELIQKEFPDAKINLLCERSFGELEDSVRQVFLDRFASWPILANILSKLAVALLHSCQWEMDAERAAASLKGKLCIVYSKVDEAIPFISTLYSRMKHRVRDGLILQPIRCVKMLANEVVNAVSAHARGLTFWEKFEIANELKRMFSLQPEDPINIRNVKEIGSPSQGPDKDFHVALHAANRLNEYFQRTPEEVDAMTDQLTTVLHSVQSEELLLRHFEQQEIALKRGEEPLSVNVSPQAVKAFYMRVLNRTRVSILLEQLEKKVREHGVQAPERRLMQKLEEIPLSAEDAQALGMTNLAHRLYGEYYTVYEQLRRNGVAWPAPHSVEFGRQGFNAQIPIPNIVRIRAIENLKRSLIQSGWYLSPPS